MAHDIGSLVFQAFGVPEEAVKSMLTAIEEMKYFLRTVYGDSTEFAGSKIEIKFLGLCQGSGVAPAGWTVIEITCLEANKKNRPWSAFCLSNIQPARTLGSDPVR